MVENANRNEQSVVKEIILEKMNHRQNSFGTVRGHQNRGRALAPVISCVSIYGITISLFTPLLSLILEERTASSILIGGLAMMVPLGVILGSFFVPRSDTKYDLPPAWRVEMPGQEMSRIVFTGVECIVDDLDEFMRRREACF